MRKNASSRNLPSSNAGAPDSQRERRKQAFRDKIIHAAIELFKQQGFDKTTLEQICEKALISRPTFYSYYTSKQELISGLGEQLWLNVIKELTSTSLANAESTQQYIKSFLLLTKNEISKYSHLERELIRRNIISDPRVSGSTHIFNSMTAMFVAVFTQGKKRGDIGTRYPADFLADMAMGSISSTMMNWAFDENYPIEKRLKQLSDYLPRTLELSQ